MNAFVQKVKDSKVPHPTQQSFTLEKWREAYERESDRTLADQRLYAAGMWAFKHFEQIRRLRSQFSLDGLPAPEQVRLAVAPANRDTYHVWRAMLPETMHSGYIIEQAIQTTVEGNEHGLESIHPDTAVTATVDGARFPLGEALGRAKEPSADTRLQDEEVVRRARANYMYGQLYSFVHGLWMQCLWNGWYIAGELSGGFIMLPPEDGLADMYAVSDFRRQAVSAETAHSAIDNWHRLSEGQRRASSSRLPQVTVKGSGKKRDYDVRVPTKVPDITPAAFVHRFLIEGDFYRPLLDLPLPRHPSLTLNRLLDAWEVLASLAKALRDTLPNNTRFSTAVNLLRYAPVIRYDQVAGLLSRWLRVGPDVAGAIIEFFTFVPRAGAELWAKPLVRVEKDRLTLLLAPLLQGNVPRTFDLWLKESGFDLTDKGFMFEGYAREELRRFIAASGALRDADVYGGALKVPDGDGEEEIDLLLRVRNVVLVGEVKSQLFPSEPLELHNYLKTLRRAAAQIARKHEAVLRSRDYVLNALGLSERFRADDVKFVPFVLTNHPLGSGHPVEGIPVTDLHALGQYLRDGRWFPLTVRSGGVSTGVAERPFYLSEEQAAAGIRDYITAPPQIEFYRSHRRYKPVHYRFLLLGDQEFKRIECTVELPGQSHSL